MIRWLRSNRSLHRELNTAAAQAQVVMREIAAVRAEGDLHAVQRRHWQQAYDELASAISRGEFLVDLQVEGNGEAEVRPWAARYLTTAGHLPCMAEVGPVKIRVRVQALGKRT